jgi:hypothetical protein
VSGPERAQERRAGDDGGVLPDDPVSRPAAALSPFEVPLTADAVMSPRLVYGSLPLTADR